jgi:pilus assembly protein Flp/PilA
LKKLIEKITYFLISKEKGATAVEYALIVALIAMVIIVGLTAVGGGINTAFSNIAGKITGAVGS